MRINIKLVIKVMDGSNVSIIVDNNQIPSFSLPEEDLDAHDAIIRLCSEYGIHEAYINPKLIDFVINDGEGYIYYTIHFPKEFLDEKTISKLCNNFEQLSEQDRIAIRQSFSILPY